MAHIAVNPENLRATAAALRAHSSRIQSAVAAIEAEMTRLSPDQFSGQRAEALRARSQAARERFAHFAAMLNKFADQLDEAAEAFRRADAGAQTESAADGSNFQLATTFSTGAQAARAQAAQAALRTVNWNKLW
jgi:WXG100 family type VII secretion target